MTAVPPARRTRRGGGGGGGGRLGSVRRAASVDGATCLSWLAAELVRPATEKPSFADGEAERRPAGHGCVPSLALRSSHWSAVRRLGESDSVSRPASLYFCNGPPKFGGRSVFFEGGTSK